MKGQPAVGLYNMYARRAQGMVKTICQWTKQIFRPFL